MTYASFVDCALAGYPEAAVPRAAAAARAGDHAGVLVVTEVPHDYPYLVTCVRTEEGWVEGSSGTGTIQWGLTDEEADRGVLFVWGRTSGKDPKVRVGTQWHHPQSVADDGYWLLLLEDVPETVIDDVTIRE